MFGSDKEEDHAKKFKAFMNAKPRARTFSQQNLIETSFLGPQEVLPYVLSPGMPDVALPAWAKSNSDFIESKLMQYGAILFRGFHLSTVAHFQEVAAALAPGLLDYEERSSPRHEVSDKVFTSTEYPADQHIMLHNEHAYAHTWPLKIMFFCQQAAISGGATPLADSRKVFERIDREIRDQFLQKKIMYVRNFGKELDLPWQVVFQTQEKAEVERYCREAGIEWEWQGNDHLRTRQIRHVVARHPRTHEMVWFNQAHMFHISSLEPATRRSLEALVAREDLPRNVYYGNGSEIEDAVIEHIRTAYQQEMVSFPWQEGDVLLADNMLVAHGRAPYVGPRKVLVAMAEAISERDIQR